jgi:hypothetical protein
MLSSQRYGLRCIMPHHISPPVDVNGDQTVMAHGIRSNQDGLHAGQIASFYDAFDIDPVPIVMRRCVNVTIIGHYPTVDTVLAK